MLLACGIVYWSTPGIGHWPLLLMASAVSAAYLALNIGANDAANHASIVVGAGVLSLGTALLIAGTGELAGAFLASDPVSERLRQGLFNKDEFGSGLQLALVLMSGLLAGALWLNLATYLRIPVSTTHSVIGGLLGAGVIAGGWSAPRWEQITNIATVWVIAPVISALIAGLALFLIEKSIIQKANLIGAARTWVPAMLTLLALLLADYFFSELAPQHWEVIQNPSIASLAIATTAFLIMQPIIHRTSQKLTNNRRGVNQLFGPPLILAAIFFAFAHGANDVANLAAPLTAIAHVATAGTSPASFSIPLWALALGGLGMCLGLLLYGHRVIRTVGNDLTELDRIRAFCIIISAAFIIAAASHFGFPVSTTHILVGSIFGVGLLREQLALIEQTTLVKIRKCFADKDVVAHQRFLARLRGATVQRKQEMLNSLYQDCRAVELNKAELKNIRKQFKRHLIRRSLARRIILFWVLTLPVSAIGGSVIYLLIKTSLGAS